MARETQAHIAHQIEPEAAAATPTKPVSKSNRLSRSNKALCMACGSLQIHLVDLDGDLKHAGVFHDATVVGYNLHKAMNKGA